MAEANADVLGLKSGGMKVVKSHFISVSKARNVLLKVWESFKRAGGSDRCPELTSIASKTASLLGQPSPYGQSHGLNWRFGTGIGIGKFMQLASATAVALVLLATSPWLAM
jgi:hypothetical protein